MVHRTDIAGAGWGRHALAMTACAAESSLLEKNPSPGSLPASRTGGMNGCRLTTSVAAVRTIHLDLATP